MLSYRKQPQTQTPSEVLRRGDSGGGAGVMVGSGSKIWLFNTKEAGMQRVNPFGGLSSANKGTGLKTKVEGGGAVGER